MNYGPSLQFREPFGACHRFINFDPGSGLLVLLNCVDCDALRSERNLTNPLGEAQLVFKIRIPQR